jgi:hypothetical protein
MVTIHIFISGNDSFGIRYAEKVPINIIRINIRIVVLHCFTQNQKNQPDNLDLAFLSCSFLSITLQVYNKRIKNTLLIMIIWILLARKKQIFGLRDLITFF